MTEEQKQLIRQQNANIALVEYRVRMAQRNMKAKVEEMKNKFSLDQPRIKILIAIVVVAITIAVIRKFNERN
jgi:hypothetical protein